MSQIPEEIIDGVAIIGMAGRFPGAGSVEALWENLCNGVEAITFLTPEEDRAVAADPSLRENPHYVPAGAFLDGVELFDAAFFGYTAREAQIMDPQQRLFLECAWEALERAGYDTQQYSGRIGGYAGAGMNTYLLDHVYPNRDLLGSISAFQTMLSSEKDFLATRMAYKLGLKGPALTVQTACSTSLVAVALACQALLSYQCDMALAGGVSLLALEREGYFYEQGGIAAPDGHCRAFDAQAQGTVGGSGLGVVVLKRLEDALNDGDTIYAVIRGSAMNNDGDVKMGYTAPSVEGQAEVITEALALANVPAESISYIEAHGTGTFVGDPIEVAALTQAFHTQTRQTGFCAIGSIKTNIGHLDTAAGVTGLIKTSLALTHKLLPPSLNFTQPNPQIDFASSPFYVNTELSDWHAGATPRRAGVSSFGIGGTNVHVVLEEPPVADESDPGRAAELLVLSAKTPAALEAATDNLVAHLRAHPEQKLADVAYTLQVGRRAFPHRRIVVAESHADAIASLEGRAPRKVFSAVKEPGDTSVVFLFPGQGAQHVNMGRQLYETEPTYRACVDECSAVLLPLLGLDLRTLLFPEPGQEQAATEQLNQTGIAQAALFVTEYAVTRLLDMCGVQPTAMIGHSLGEYVAACVAGVMSLEDALFLVAERGRLMQAMQPGTMLSISLGAPQVRDLLPAEVSLAVVYGPSLCVVGGPEQAIEALAQRLAEQGIDHRRLHTSHAFHSDMMEPMLEPFRQTVSQITLHPPRIPYISCTTGTWISAEQAVDPGYWATHVRQTVQLADGLQTLLNEPGRVLVEVGPVQTLKALLKQISSEAARGFVSVPAMRHPLESQADIAVLLSSLGKLWLLGIHMNLAGLYAGQRRQRIVLPTYPFERRRYWIEARRTPQTLATGATLPADDEPIMALDTVRPTLLNEYVAPRTETERKVAAIWSEQLGSGEIGIHDDFFELGGDSLLGIGLMTRLRTAFQVELPERTLYDQPTIAALSAAIDSSSQALDTIKRIPRDQPLPVSWQMERRWLRDQRYPDQRHNNNLSIGWELHGALDAALFERSLNAVIARHEIMRTAVAEIDGQLQQVIAPQLTVALPLIDLTHLPEAERDDEMLRLAAEAERTPFDMAVAPLWRMVLYRLDHERHAWIIVAHQSIWDGVSAHSVQHEIGVFLEALLRGQPTPEPGLLPELPIQFADFAHWERQRFQGALLDEHLDYWRHKLAGELEPLELPTDRPREIEHALSAVIEWDLPRQLGDRLKLLGQEQGATLYVTMVAAFKALCYGYSGQEDILVESSFANRERPEVEHLVAPLVNMVTLRTDLRGNPSFRQLLGRVRDTVMGAMAHRDFPFVKALELIQPEFYGSHRRLGRVFVAQYAADGEYPPLADLHYGQRLWFRRAMPDIYMSLVDYEERIEVAWEYSTHLFDEETIRRMFATYTALLEQVVAEPDRALHDLAFETEVRL